MTVKLHFETLALGMKAKLDARYRTQTNYVHIPATLYGNGSSAALLGDSIGKNRPTLIKKNK